MRGIKTSNLFDLHVIYNPDIERVFKKLSFFGFRYVGVSFDLSEKKKVSEVRKIAEGYGLEMISRVDLALKNVQQYSRLVLKARKFDLICIEQAPLQILKRVNLRKVSLLSIYTASPILMRKITSMKTDLAVEFSFAKFFRILKERRKEIGRIIRNIALFDSANVPMVVSSGARSELEVISPTQMIYSFSAILHKKEVNKKYISTIPMVLMRETL